MLLALHVSATFKLFQLRRRGACLPEHIQMNPNDLFGVKKCRYDGLTKEGKDDLLGYLLRHWHTLEAETHGPIMDCCQDNKGCHSN